MIEIPTAKEIKALRVINGKADARYMRMRRGQNLVVAKRSKAEQWMAELLKSSGYKWTRQVIWGHRIFDFWCARLGIAVEVDGPEHDKNYDAHRDGYNLRRSALVVLRVRNFNEDDARLALAEIASSDTWMQRRRRFGLKGTKLARRRLLCKPTDITPSPGCVILTEKLIFDGATNLGGWNKDQLAAVGVKWPTVRGWKKRLVGTEVSIENYTRFLALKGLKPKERR